MECSETTPPVRFVLGCSAHLPCTPFQDGASSLATSPRGSEMQCSSGHSPTPLAWPTGAKYYHQRWSLAGGGGVLRYVLVLNTHHCCCEVSKRAPLYSCHHTTGPTTTSLLLLIGMSASGGAIMSRGHHHTTACALTWRSSSPDSRAWHRHVCTCTKLADPQAAGRAGPRCILTSGGIYLLLHYRSWHVYRCFRQPLYPLRSP